MMLILVNVFLGVLFGWCAKTYTNWGWVRSALNFLAFAIILLIMEVALGLFEGGGGAE